MSLMARLLLLVVLATIPGLLLAVHNEYVLRQAREAEVRAEVVRQTNQATAEMRQVIEGVQRVAATIAQIPLVQEAALGAASPSVCADLLLRLRREYPGELEVGVANKDGYIVCTSRGSTNLGFASGSRHQRAIETGKFVVGGYAAARGQEYLTFAYPIKDDEGRAIGSVLPGIGLKWLTEHMSMRFSGLDAVLAMADRDLTYLLRLPTDDLGLVGKPAPPQAQRLAAMAGKGAFDATGVDNVRRVAAITPLMISPDAAGKADLLVAIGLSREAALAPIEAATRRAIVLLVFTFVLALIGAIVGARYFVRSPVERLLAVASRWKAGDYSQRVQIKSSGEFGALGSAFNKMAEEIDSREQHRNLLINELNHRVKNTLATVQSLASNSLRVENGSGSRAALEGRLLSLAKAHDVLTRENWQSADILEAVEQATGAFAGENQKRFTVSGPSLRVPPGVVLTLCLNLHELCTNAVKYGALSNETGQVSITWEVDRADDPSLLIVRWQEHGGPQVAQPTRKGFGSRLLERSLKGEDGGRAELLFQPSGVICTMVIPLRDRTADRPKDSVAA